MENLSELLTIFPEIFILTMTCLLMVLDLYTNKNQGSLVFFLAIITLVFASIITVGPIGAVAPGESAIVFSGTVIRDQLADTLKLFIYLITILVFIYSRVYLQQKNLFKGEFYILSLFGMLGMMILVSANNLITIYLGIELMALCSYALVALNRDQLICTEAAMKYFVLGAIASGMLLYGMSMLYGSTGTLDLPQIALAITEIGKDDILLIFGLVFIVIGLAFKFGAVPFHMWIPDVYQGAPTPVTMYIAAAPKLAAFALAFRLLGTALNELLVHWQMMLIIMATLSIALGNLVAIAQTNIKRMLAYSTIAHIGFILLGILSGSEQGFAASMFYVIVYAFMTTGSFGMLILLAGKGYELQDIQDFKGMNKQNPWFAAIMALLMLSLAGVPPLVGFAAKLFVLQAIMEQGLYWLAVVAVIFSIIGAFYYLRVIKVMYFEAPETDHKLNPDFDLRAVLSINGLAQLALLFLVGPLFAACVAAISF